MTQLHTSWFATANQCSDPPHVSPCSVYCADEHGYLDHHLRHRRDVGDVTVVTVVIFVIFVTLVTPQELTEANTEHARSASDSERRLAEALAKYAAGDSLAALACTAADVGWEPWECSPQVVNASRVYRLASRAQTRRRRCQDCELGAHCGHSKCQSVVCTCGGCVLEGCRQELVVLLLWNLPLLD